MDRGIEKGIIGAESAKFTWKSCSVNGRSFHTTTTLAGRLVEKKLDSSLRVVIDCIQVLATNVSYIQTEVRNTLLLHALPAVCNKLHDSVEMDFLFSSRPAKLFQ